MKNYLVLFCFLSLLYGCKKISCLESSGDVVTSRRMAAPFHQIDLFDNINLILTQDTAESIQVEAGQYMQPNIVTTIEKGTLTIRNNATCNWLRAPSEKINVYVSVTKLNGITYNGSGNISSSNVLDADSIRFFSKDGAGNIDIHLHAKQTTVELSRENADLIFHGKSDLCYAFSHERGTIDFKDFEVKKMYLNYVGVRDAFVNVTEELYATIYHTGNVYYKGAPSVVVMKSYSSGKLYVLP